MQGITDLYRNSVTRFISPSPLAQFVRQTNPSALLEKFLADFPVCDYMMPLLQSSTVCDVKFRQIEGNGRKFRHT